MCALSLLYSGRQATSCGSCTLRYVRARQEVTRGQRSRMILIFFLYLLHLSFAVRALKIYLAPAQFFFFISIHHHTYRHQGTGEVLNIAQALHCNRKLFLWG